MQHRAPRRPRTLVATSVVALVVGGGGAVGLLVAGPAQGTDPQEVTLAEAGQSRWQAARDRWWDGQRASRQAWGGRAGGTAGKPPSATPAPPAAAPTTALPGQAAVPPQAAAAAPQPAGAPAAAAQGAPSGGPGAAAPAAPAAPAPVGGQQQGTGATGYEAFDYVEEFETPVARGQWPGDGRGPAAYPQYLSYVDGTSDKYFPSQVLSVHDGVLDWYCHDSKAAAVLPFGYEGFTYGTYTVRMRTENFPQYHIAFLLWPTTDKWTHELDGPEGETTDTHPYPAVLQSGPPTPTFAPDGKKKVPSSWNDAEFHDYTWQWTPDEVRFYQDGVLVSTATGNIPQESMRPVLQVEWSNQLGGGRPDPSITGHVYVDAVMYDADPGIAVPVV